jgi:hypothetical protein
MQLNRYIFALSVELSEFTNLQWFINVYQLYDAPVKVMTF